MEWYRDDLEEAKKKDPYPKMINLLESKGISKTEISNIESRIKLEVDEQYESAFNAENPATESIQDYIFAPTDITEEVGERTPKGKKKTVMVDSVLPLERLCKSTPKAYSRARCWWTFRWCLQKRPHLPKLSAIIEFLIHLFRRLSL